jgi:hypothetical protein
MLGYWGRIKVYAAMAAVAFGLLVLGSPIGSSGVWLAALLLCGIALWWEFSDYPDVE